MGVETTITRLNADAQKMLVVQDIFTDLLQRRPVDAARLAHEVATVAAKYCSDVAGPAETLPPIEVDVKRFRRARR